LPEHKHQTIPLTVEQKLDNMIKAAKTISQFIKTYQLEVENAKLKEKINTLQQTQTNAAVVAN